MLHVRFHTDKLVDSDSLSDFCNGFKHLSPTLEGYFFNHGVDLVFVSNVSSFEFSYDLINLVIKELNKKKVYSEVLSVTLT